MSQTQKKVSGTLIRKENILIGEQALELREPSIKVTHEALDVLFDDGLINAVTQIASLIKEREAQRDAAAEVMSESDVGPDVLAAVERRSWVTFLTDHASDIAGIIKGAVIPILSRKAGEIVAIAIDTKENRKRTNLASAELRDYVLEELTPSQALDVLIALKDLIDWESLGKKVKALLPNLVTELVAPTTVVASETQTSPLTS
jgi:hypothetical protein